jgi:hypothetical protein
MNNRKIVYESGEFNLLDGDSYSIKDSYIYVFLHSKRKMYKLPHYKIKYIEEDLEKVSPNDYLR